MRFLYSKFAVLALFILLSTFTYSGECLDCNYERCITSISNHVYFDKDIDANWNCSDGCMRGYCLNGRVITFFYNTMNGADKKIKSKAIKAFKILEEPYYGLRPEDCTNVLKIYRDGDPVVKRAVLELMIKTAKYGFSGNSFLVAYFRTSPIIQKHVTEKLLVWPECLNRPWTEEDYDNMKLLSNNNLKIYRNAFAALHGYEFKNPKLTAYFKQFAWYKPSKKYSESLLTAEQNKITKAMWKEKKFRDYQGQARLRRIKSYKLEFLIEEEF